MTPRVSVPPFCVTHAHLLVYQLGFGDTDPWRALTVVAQVTLFQALISDPTTCEKVGGAVENLSSLGCFACVKPDAFGEIIAVGQQAGRSGAIAAIKKYGEKLVSR